VAGAIKLRHPVGTGGWRSAARVALRPYSPAGPMPGPVLSCLR